MYVVRLGDAGGAVCEILWCTGVTDLRKISSSTQLSSEDTLGFSKIDLVFPSLGIPFPETGRATRTPNRVYSHRLWSSSSPLIPYCHPEKLSSFFLA